MIWRFLIVYLLSAIAANLIMTFLMRYSEHHDDNRYALNIWNYLAGTLISIIFLKDKSVIFSGDFITLFSRHHQRNRFCNRSRADPDQYPKKWRTINNYI